MSISKILGILAASLIIAVALFNFWPKKKSVVMIQEELSTVEVVQKIAPEVVPEEVVVEPSLEPVVVQIEDEKRLTPISDDGELPPEVDRISLIFQPSDSPLIPIVETVKFSSRPDWLTGRPAYLGDYASHYKTSKHFISRSLHGMGNYLSEIVSKDDRFNVLRTDKNISFHLVLDLSRLKLWFYAINEDDNQRFLLKTYSVCAGRLNSNSLSGSRTPLGTYSIGSEFALYKEGVQGHFKGDPCEMITIFGVRWIPLDREIANCTASSKGLGLHGVPWKRDSETGELVEKRECIGNYESGGCIRLLTEDIEELYAILASRPAQIQIVSDFTQAKLPGQEIVF